MMKNRKRKGTVRRMTAILAVAASAFMAGCQETEKAGQQAVLTDTENVETRDGKGQDNSGGVKVHSLSVEATDSYQDGQGIESGVQEEPKTDTCETDRNQKEDNDDTAGQDKVQPEKKKPPEGWELNLASEDWGLSFGEPGTCPTGNASAEDLAWYDAYYVGGDSEKVIYLTFDCGYENGNTEPILDALKKHDVKATFFVVGHFLETAPDMAKRMVADGHVVGNHTYHHPDMPSISDMDAFREEVDSVADLFKEITGEDLAPYYRPPQGKCNAENLKMAHELGYQTVFWSLAYVDWNQDDQPSHEEAFDKLTARVHPGAVVLLHNTSDTNAEIMDELLTRWVDFGYTFKPLEELGQ